MRIILPGREARANRVVNSPTTTVAGMAEQNRWTVEQQVREDAASVFVAEGDLAGAEIGDAVTITDPESGVMRAGRVSGRAEDPTRGCYLTIELS